MSARVSDTFPAAGVHTSRPASPGSAPSFYSCTTHNLIYRWDGTSWSTWATLGAAADKTEVLMIALGDETTALTTGTAKVTFRMPWAFTVTAVRASLTAASSSGIPTFDINEAGVSILSTKLTIDASEKTSVTAATPAVVSDANLADDAEMTIDCTIAGTGAKGAKIYLYGTRP